jgi:hypothetical protein
MSRIETPTMHGMRQWLHRAMALAAVPLLIACSVEVDQGGGGRPIRPAPICTMEYAPVCAERGRDRQTFPNACEARSNGYDVLGRGECRGERPDSRPNDGRACTRELAPICGQRGRDRQTFPNACEARSSGYDIIGRGECSIGRPGRDGDDVGGWDRDDRDRRGRDRRDRDGDNWDGDGRDDRDGRVGRDRPRDRDNETRACTREFAPVCGRRGRTSQTFGNACEAQAAGFNIAAQGECSR